MSLMHQYLGDIGRRLFKKKNRNDVIRTEWLPAHRVPEAMEAADMIDRGRGSMGRYKLYSLIYRGFPSLKPDLRGGDDVRVHVYPTAVRIDLCMGMNSAAITDDIYLAGE